MWSPTAGQPRGLPLPFQPRLKKWRDLFLAGLFVLAMLAVAAAVLTLLAPGFLGGYTLRAYFEDADGLERGIDVMQEGFVIGRVRSVDPVFSDDGDRGDCPEPSAPRAAELPCFRATLAIQPRWPVPEQPRLL